MAIPSARGSAPPVNRVGSPVSPWPYSMVRPWALPSPYSSTTSTLGHDLAPEDVAEGLRHADHVPLPVGHHEVRGMPALLREIQAHSRGSRGRACRRIFYRGGLLLPVVFGEQQV